MIRVVTVDDQESARNVIKNLAQVHGGIEIIGEADGVQAGVDLINSLKPDLAFLDIEMEDGTGFDILDKLGDTNTKVIFATSHDSFMLKAIRYSAIDYLLKPVDETEFIEAVNRVEVDESQQDLLNNLKEAIRENRQTKRMALYTHGKYEFVEPDSIICVKSDNKYCEVSVEGKDMFVSKSIKEFEELLDPSKFVRVHREYLINAEAVKSYSKEDGGIITMINDKSIPVSRRRKQMVEEILFA